MRFQKIASVLASAVMLSSTVGFAGLAAAAMYPDPFVKNGMADVAIVYGSHPAASADLVGALNIQTNLNSKVLTNSVTSTPISADCEGLTCVKLDKSSDHVNLGNALNGPFGSTLDDGDLTEYLADGTYTADDSDTFDYEQSITYGGPVLSFFRESDYENQVGLNERTPTIGFNISSDAFVMNYTLDFSTDAVSTVTSGDLDDFEGSYITLLGKSYYISDAVNGSSATTFGKFTLLDSANSALINEGEVATITVGDKTYEVSASIYSSTQVVLTVNGETLNSLNAGGTAKLAGTDTYVGVQDIFYVSKDTGVSSVKVSIGSGKIEITSGSNIKINGDTVNGVKGYIFRGTVSGESQTLDKVVIEWKTHNNAFLTPEADLVLPGFNSAKFNFANWVRPEEEKVSIENSGTTSIALVVPVKDGDATINLLYANSTGEFQGLGKASDERLATSPTSELIFRDRYASSSYHEYFVASYNSSKDSESYLLSFENIEETDNKNRTDVVNRVTGDTVAESKVAGNTVKIGKVSFTINEVSYNSTDRFVNVTASSGVNFNTVYTTGGLKIYLPFVSVDAATGYANDTNGEVRFTPNTNTSAGHNDDSFYLYMDGEDKDDTIAGGTEFYLTINDNADNELEVTQLNGAGSAGPGGLQIGDTKNYEAYIVDDVAPRVVHYTDANPDYAEVYYPMGDSESYAEVFFSADSVSIGTGSGAVGAPILDTEVSQASGKNLIVVGGSCVNTVAAELLGRTSRFCGTEWTTATGVGQDTFLIETFARTGGKVATLVAGWGAADTTNAATALTTQSVDTTAGKKYTGTTASSIQAMLS